MAIISMWSCRKVIEGSFRYCTLGSCSWISTKAPKMSSFRYPIIPKMDHQKLFCGAAMMSTMTVNSGKSALSCPPKSSPWLSKTSPWLMLPPVFDDGHGDMVYQFYCLGENKVLGLKKMLGGDGDGDEEMAMEWPDDKAEIVGSSHGWLVLFDKDDCDLFISNPISRRHIKLPRIHTLPIPKIKLRTGRECVTNVIISSSSPDEEDCRAMMIYGPNDRLAFCCPGRSTEWTPLGDLTGYASCVYSSRQKLFFCCTKRDDHFEAWDLGDPLSPRMIPMVALVDDDKHKCSCDHYKFLVVAEESDEIFQVRRFLMHSMGPHGYFVEDYYYGPKMGFSDDSVPYRTVGFDVHKYDPETGILKYMDRSLDGLALFIGSNNGFAISAAEFPELKPNSIYYTGLLEWADVECGGHDVGIFNYQDKTFSPCYYPLDVQIMKRISGPKWFTPTPLSRFSFGVGVNNHDDVSSAPFSSSFPPTKEAMEDGRILKEAIAGRFRCCHCKQKFDSPNQLTKHYEAKHSDIIDGFRCHCGACF